METCFTTKIWIVGVPTPYALCYQDDSNAVIPVELQSFRPDPEIYLETNQEYDAVLAFETDVYTLNFLRRIDVSIKKGTTCTFYRF